MLPHAQVNCVDPVWWLMVSYPHLKEDYVYCHQKHGVFTSPNSLFPPPFPLPAPTSSLESSRTTTPAFQNWPYLTLIPTAPWFDNPLLNGLSSLPNCWRLWNNLPSPTISMRAWSLHVLKSKINFSTWLRFSWSSESASTVRRDQLFPTSMGINFGTKTVQKHSRLLSSLTSLFVYSWVTSASAWWPKTIHIVLLIQKETIIDGGGS